MLSWWVCTLAFSQTGKLLIEKVTVVSPHRIGRHEVKDVYIEKGLISKIENKIDLKKTKGVQIIKGEGKYLIPGLIDGNVQLQTVPGMSWDQQQKLGKLRAIYYRQMPKSFLYYGFTTVINTNVLDPAFLKDFEQIPLKPDVVHCGQALTPINGYPMVLFPQSEQFLKFPNFIVDEKQKSLLPKGEKFGKHQIPAAMANIKKMGGVCAKAYVEPGEGKEFWPVFSEAQLKTLSAEAANKKLPLMVHSRSMKMFDKILNHSPAMLSHGLSLWEAEDKHTGVPENVRNMLDRVIQGKVGYMAGLRLDEGDQLLFDSPTGKLQDLTVFKEARWLAVTPLELQDFYKSRDAYGYPRKVASGHDVSAQKTPKDKFKAIYQKLEASVGRGKRALKYVADFNGNVLFGSGTGETGSFINMPGLNGFREIVSMAKSETTPDVLFKAVTINTAKAFGLEKSLGSVEVGKKANLLLLKENPLNNVKAYEQIEVIIIGGQHIERAGLAAQL